MKKFAVLLFLLLVASGAFASSPTYKEIYSETRTVLVDYDNPDRHSTYDYRHGYTYRDSREYFEDHYWNSNYYSNNKVIYLDDRDDYDRNYRYYFSDDYGDELWEVRDRDYWGRLSEDEGYYGSYDRGFNDWGWDEFSGKGTFSNSARYNENGYYYGDEYDNDRDYDRTRYHDYDRDYRYMGVSQEDYDRIVLSSRDAVVRRGVASKDGLRALKLDYVPYLDEVREVSCYLVPPVDKLFYIHC